MLRAQISVTLPFSLTIRLCHSSLPAPLLNYSLCPY